MEYNKTLARMSLESKVLLHKYLIEILSKLKNLPSYSE